MPYNDRRYPLHDCFPRTLGSNPESYSFLVFGRLDVVFNDLFPFDANPGLEFSMNAGWTGIGARIVELSGPCEP
jgi:hypothetical protein